MSTATIESNSEKRMSCATDAEKYARSPLHFHLRSNNQRQVPVGTSFCIFSTEIVDGSEKTHSIKADPYQILRYQTLWHPSSPFKDFRSLDNYPMLVEGCHEDHTFKLPEEKMLRAVHGDIPQIQAKLYTTWWKWDSNWLKFYRNSAQSKIENFPT